MEIAKVARQSKDERAVEFAQRRLEKTENRPRETGTGAGTGNRYRVSPLYRYHYLYLGWGAALRGCLMDYVAGVIRQQLDEHEARRRLGRPKLRVVP
jgi:hypothetical protein